MATWTAVGSWDEDTNEYYDGAETVDRLVFVRSVGEDPSGTDPLAHFTIAVQDLAKAPGQPSRIELTVVGAANQTDLVTVYADEADGGVVDASAVVLDPSWNEAEGDRVRFVGSDHDDTIFGTSGGDSFQVASGGTPSDPGHDSIDGGAGTDSLHIYYYSDATPVTSDGIDGLIYGTASLHWTGIERTKISLGSGNDRVSLGGSEDLVFAGLGHDEIEGGAGQDELVGEGGKDRLYGGADDDILRGDSHPNEGATIDAATDVLHGGDGNDRLDGGAGADSLYGGDGDDVVVFDRAGDHARGGSGRDRVESSVSLDLTTTARGIEDVVLTGSANAGVLGGAGAGRITGNAGANAIVAGGGADTVKVGGDARTDTISVDRVSDSTGLAHDVVTGFDAGFEDVLIFGHRIDELVFAPDTSIEEASFDADVAAAVNGALHSRGPREAVVFEDSEDGSLYLVIYAKNDGSYSAGSDYVVQLVGLIGTLDLGDFQNF